MPGAVTKIYELQIFNHNIVVKSMLANFFKYLKNYTIILMHLLKTTQLWRRLIEYYVVFKNYQL